MAKTTLVTIALALILALGTLLPSPVLAASSSVPQPFTGAALWITQVPVLQTGQQLAAEAAAAGVRTLYVKAS